MRTPASCRGCAGRNRPRVQHWRCTRCCMTRCRARRTESNCQVGNRRRARLPRCELITAPWVVQHVQPGADHATARPQRCARLAGAAASASATATVCGQQINRLPPTRLNARPCLAALGRPGTDVCAVHPAQTQEPRPNSQKTALSDSRSQPGPWLASIPVPPRCCAVPVCMRSKAGCCRLPRPTTCWPITARSASR